jgi:hypothetical protein
MVEVSRKATSTIDFEVMVDQHLDMMLIKNQLFQILT